MKSEPLKPSSIIFVEDVFLYAKRRACLGRKYVNLLTAYFAQRVERDMDKLWDEGL